ncbi:MAG: radical SAM protein [Candidatus Pacearchaeota archaeon]
MIKSKYKSYYLNGISNGCKYCVRGEKLVLFISGKCERNCYYCSLSKKRKNKNISWANERKISSIKDIIKEVKDSNSTSAGITGGDPFLFLNKTINYAKALKNKFRKKFHIHIYLPTKNLTENKLKKLSKYIEEVRFHPDFLCNKKSDIDTEINKIKIAKKFWKKKDIGIELPMIPEKKKEILEFILKIKNDIGFVNLNELELSETNFEIMTKNYRFNKTGYVIINSKNAGLWVLKNLEKFKIKLKVHLCTAELKNQYQYKNRLKLHKMLPFGRRTKDGTVIYLKTNKKPKAKSGFYFDKQKNQYILSNNLANKLIEKQKIFRIEEFPTFDRTEIEKEEIKI